MSAKWFVLANLVLVLNSDLFCSASFHHLKCQEVEACSCFTCEKTIISAALVQNLLRDEGRDQQDQLNQINSQGTDRSPLPVPLPLQEHQIDSFGAANSSSSSSSSFSSGNKSLKYELTFCSAGIKTAGESMRHCNNNNNKRALLCIQCINKVSRDEESVIIGVDLVDDDDDVDALNDETSPANLEGRNIGSPLTGQGFDEEPEEVETDMSSHKVYLSTTYLICSNVSNIFLIITFVVYIILPGLRRPLFGKIIMAFILSLFCAYFMLGATAFGRKKLMGDRDITTSTTIDTNKAVCQVLGFLGLFFYFHGFFWMNVLSYDIYRKFTRVRSLAKQEGQSDRIRLIKYACYAIGASLTLTLITLTVEFLPDSYQGIRPGFGEKSCFFSTNLANFLFFHLYIVVIQVANIVFFVLTIKYLRSTWKITQKLGGSTYSGGRARTKSKNSKENFRVIAKLFIVMGVTWLSEFVSFILGWIFGEEKVWKYFIVNDVINLSQGILIFLVLICKRSVIARLRSKCCLATRFNNCRSGDNDGCDDDYEEDEALSFKEKHNSIASDCHHNVSLLIHPHHHLIHHHLRQHRFRQDSHSSGSSFGQPAQAQTSEISVISDGRLDLSEVQIQHHSCAHHQFSLEEEVDERDKVHKEVVWLHHQASLDDVQEEDNEDGVSEAELNVICRQQEEEAEDNDNVIVKKEETAVRNDVNVECNDSSGSGEKSRN